MRFHAMMLAALLPMQAVAEEAVIRIEAKRGVQAAGAAAQLWRQHFDDVLTFELPRGWVGIALGPMPAEEAAARLQRLRAEGLVPEDSFVTGLGGDRPIVAVAPPVAGPDAEMPAEMPAVEAVTAGTLSASSPADQAGGMADAERAPADPAVAVPNIAVPDSGLSLGAMQSAPLAVTPPQSHIRLQALEDRAEAEARLAHWREAFPGAALWALPNGWFAVALGPMRDEVAQAWLPVLRDAGAVPKDAFLATTIELGAPVAAGAAPDLPAPPDQPAALPPLDQTQRALRWAGHYDGAIDGQDGPRTRAAIAAEIAAERASPDAGTAIRALMQRRMGWEDEMGLSMLRDSHTGLSLDAPKARLQHDRTERAMSIYGPRDGSGAALILFSQPGGQQELQDMAGLITALGWVPQPERDISAGRMALIGRNATHIGQAQGRVSEGRAEGWVLIWPVADALNQRRIADEMARSLTRFAPADSDPAPELPPDGPDAPMPLPGN